MALDIIARAAASAARIDAAKAVGRLVHIDSFGILDAITVDPAITSLTTGGYSNPGTGAALYACDALANAALAAAHPRFCKATANGRYFRLAGDFVTVEHGGATGSGNDQAAMQAAVDYASAVGISEVRFTRPAYEAWSPTRTGDPASWHEGHLLYITKGNLRLIGAPGGTVITYKNSLGGTNDTNTQTFTGTGSLTNWVGCGVWFEPATPADFFHMENIEIDGTRTYNPADRSNVDYSHKGFAGWATCNRLSMRNVTLRNWGGEILYLGGNGYANFLTENCTFDGSPQCAFNPGAAQRSVHINLEAGRSYQSELVGFASMTFIGGRFYDCDHMSAFGGPDPSVPAGYLSYAHPTRKTTDNAPWINFFGTKLENMGTVGFYQWVRGSLQTVDTVVALGGNSSNAYSGRDFDLDVEAWCDLRSNFPAVQIAGPDNLTTAVDANHPGEYREATKNVNVRLRCNRTALAVANSRYFAAGVELSPYLLDKDTVRFQVSGAARTGWTIFGAPVAGYAVPLVRTDMDRAATNYDSLNSSPSADMAVKVVSDVMPFDPSVDGTWNITFDNTYGYADGQEVTCTNVNGGGNRRIKFQHGAAGHTVPQDRVLLKTGDWIKFRWNAAVSRWVEVGFNCSGNNVWFTGSATYDAPSIAAGGTTTTTVTVNNVLVGPDHVSRLAFGVSLQGLIASAFVSATHTVTVVLFNPTAGAIDLASTAVSVTAERQL